LPVGLGITAPTYFSRHPGIEPSNGRGGPHRIDMATTQEKKALREIAIAARAALRGPDRQAATEAATQRALEVLRHTTGVIGGYVPFRDEIHPGDLIKRLSAGGRVIGLPCTPRLGSPLVFRAWAPGDKLHKGRMNIPEPSQDAPEVFPHVLIVPPVAFDRRCYRVGYGAGFYDRTIPVLRHMHPVYALGFAFSCQEVEFVVDEQHDVPLDAIATEAELIRPPS
jgi:5-formyltetrahydrofolate cyclo-ligase